MLVVNKKVKQRDLILAFGKGVTYAEIRQQFGLSANALNCHLKRMRRIGIEPTNPDACRQHIFGAAAKPYQRKDPVESKSITPAQLHILQLIAAGNTMQEVRHKVCIGWQTLVNTTCDAFKRIGITRLRKPRDVWKAELRAYLKKQPITMDDPFFN